VRKLLFSVSPLVATLSAAAPAFATTWYVSPSGPNSSGCDSRETPCSLGAAASGAMPGDTVILTDGVYNTSLYVANSGTAAAPITFKADECSTPIIEGPGVAPDADNQDGGVASATASYLRFDGIVARGWNTGFGNGWTGNHTTDSNGHWEIENCIGDMNGRTGFTSFSAEGFKLKHSISAHNGTSTLHSWSSGITLYASPMGSVEGNVSFENMDAQQHTDGSGFIADESSDGASFVNNLAFANGGSCLRLTRSSNVKFINNTCYHDARDPLATGPTDPDEVYFSNAPSDMSTITGISFFNNALVALGSGAGLKAVNYNPTSGWSNNATATATVSYFNGAEGTNPDFTLASGASMLLGMGNASGAPTNDLGLDPKCIVKKTPTVIGMMAKGDWWSYSIDYDYIKSIGGVAKCFNPKPRSGTPDVGSYASGAVTTAMPNTCTPPKVGNGLVMGSGGSGSGGAAATAGSASTSGGTGTGTSGGTGTGTSGGTGTGTGGTGSASGGAPATPIGGAAATNAGAASTASPADPGGCGCKSVGGASSRFGYSSFALLGLALLRMRRRGALR
jgi:hypothetical protein